MTLEFILDIQRWGGGEPTAVGEGYSWVYEGKYYSVLFTRGGMFRGNHIHPCDQHTLLLSGKGKYVFRKDGENVDYPLTVGEILDVSAKVPHIFLPIKPAYADIPTPRMGVSKRLKGPSTTSRNSIFYFLGDDSQNVKWFEGEIGKERTIITDRPIIRVR